VSVSTFSRDDLKTLLARALDPVDAPEEMDFTRIARDPHDYDPVYVLTLREAGVLAPVMDRESGLTVLLTQRTAHLSNHAGQISFPGGRREISDPDLAATALRESREEIGLEPARVQVLGKLSTVVIRSGFRVTPFVGLIDPKGFRPQADPREVAEVFEAPLSFFLDPKNFHEEERDYGTGLRRFHVAMYEGRYIWGATAAMLWTLQTKLNKAAQNL
jgi:8-oxo-dGTP pyrophosphatase MutT (NUDIX family)